MAKDPRDYREWRSTGKVLGATVRMAKAGEAWASYCTANPTEKVVPFRNKA
jgi:hypothetical protein